MKQELGSQDLRELSSIILDETDIPQRAFLHSFVEGIPELSALGPR